jgi:hypothetical protein
LRLSKGGKQDFHELDTHDDCFFLGNRLERGENGKNNQQKMTKCGRITERTCTWSNRNLGEWNKKREVGYV